MQNELSVNDGILLRGYYIIIPMTLEVSFLDNIHEGHLGIVRYQQAVRVTIYWLAMVCHVEDYV